MILLVDGKVVLRLYSINLESEHSIGLSDLLSLEIAARDAKVCIYNLWPISQAGRRRFDPGLPLQLLKNLQAPKNPSLLRLLR